MRGKRSNEQRWKWAAKALSAYREAKGEPFDEANFRDLLTDLMHWCRASQNNFDEALLIARHHFEAEKR